MLIERLPLTPEVLALLARATFPRPDVHAWLATFYAPETGREVYGWQVGGRLVAVLGLENATEITHIATRPDQSGKGYGKSLIFAVVERLQARQLSAETDDDAVDFYRKCGFEVTKLETETAARGGTQRYRCILRLNTGTFAAQTPYSGA